MDQQQTPVPEVKPSSPLKSLLGIVGAIAAVGILGKFAVGSKPAPVEPATDTPSPSTEPTPVDIVVSGDGSASVVAVEKSSYKDGTYEAVGLYTSPAGAEEIKVKIVLKDDVIVDSTVIGTATNPKSIRMQDAFIGGYETLVEGKDIDAVNLGPVSGSSLTPKGFNDALAKIKAEAAS